MHGYIGAYVLKKEFSARAFLQSALQASSLRSDDLGREHAGAATKQKYCTNAPKNAPKSQVLGIHLETYSTTNSTSQHSAL